MPTLATRQLTKRFAGVHALHTLSLACTPGITGIVGPNGSGKTTLIHVLTGLLTPEQGTIYVADTPFSRMRPYECPTYGITRTFQNVRLFEQMSVLDNMLVVLTERSVMRSLFEMHPTFHLAQAERVLRKIGLWERRHDTAEMLSYGQRKLLEIGRALAMNTTIVLFDEPFAGLFPEMVEVVMTLLQELRQQGKTVLLVEHNMDIIRHLCDHLIVLDSGMVLAQGAPREVLARADVMEAYLGE